MLNRHPTKRVYFLRPIGADGPVKIGCSFWPMHRLKTYQQWSPIPLEVAVSVEGAEKLERRFHAFFIAHHSHHEWFRSAPEITATIDALKAGNFDFDSLPSGTNLLIGGEEARAGVREWLSTISRLNWMAKHGIAVPAEIRSLAHGQHDLAPEEKTRRRAVVRAFVLANDPKLKAAA